MHGFARCLVVLTMEKGINMGINVKPLPLDVRNTIKREQERDPSDPFLARRLVAHYRQGIWKPEDVMGKGLNYGS